MTSRRTKRVVGVVMNARRVRKQEPTRRTLWSMSRVFGLVVRNVWMTAVMPWECQRCNIQRRGKQLPIMRTGMINQAQTDTKIWTGTEY